MSGAVGPGAVDVDPAGAAELLRGAAEVTLLGHVQPDADALGSALALGLALRERGARVTVSFGDPASAVPESLRYLDSAGLVVPASAVPAAPELLVAADSSSGSRLGILESRVDATRAAGGAVLVVDHHPSNTRFGTHHLVDDRAEATAVLILRILDALGTELTEPVARCLYAGLSTDTSSFRRATEQTHRMAVRLLAAGADPELAARQLSDGHPFAWLPMLAAVLGRARLEQAAAGGRGLVHTTVRLDDAAGVRREDVESVVDILRGTTEADVTAVLKEQAPGRWVVSLRAVTVDVGAVAVGLGGGGHRLAAGFTVDGDADAVLASLREALRG